MASSRTEEVKVLEVCRVAPISATASTSLPFTFFDAVWLRFPPTKRLFFYQTPSLNGHGATDDTRTILISKLKHSLSITLQHYLPLAGKLVWPPESDRPIILYTKGDDSVSLTLAESGADFDRLSGYGFRQATEFHPFTPDLVGTDTEVPVIALQVTLFGDKGFSIGYATHHAVLDGKSAAMFMHSWASLCRTEGKELKPEFTPCYNRAIVEDPADLAKTYISFWLEHIGPNNKSLKMWEMKVPPSVTRGTFLLTRKNIEHIKNSVRARWQEKQQEAVVSHVTTFTVTVAFIWSCLVKAKKLSNEKVHLGFTFDCRARLDPPLPSTYFGACVLTRIVTMALKQLVGEDGVANAAEAIGREIEGVKKDGFLKDAESYMPRLFSFVFEGPLESIAGSPLFGLYDADFGWGKPKKVEVVSIDESGALSLVESGDGDGGIEIGIVLPEPQLEIFATIFGTGIEGR